MTQTPYTSDAERWLAVQERDERADGQFCYVVRTTGVYSRPSCVVRLARRENVTFFRTAAEARAAGFRPCRRCRPDEPDQHGACVAAVHRACRLMDGADGAPSLDELARTVGYSRFHFHRMFKSFTGVTPHAYLMAVRACRVRRELARAGRVSDAIYSSGFSSNGHFYAASAEILGMTPTSFRDGGRGTVIRSAPGSCSLGAVLVAATDKGVCAVLTGDDAQRLRLRLRDLFPHAELAPADAAFASLVRETLLRAEPPSQGRALPASVRSVALGERVRQLLRARAAEPFGLAPMDAVTCVS